MNDIEDIHKLSFVLMHPFYLHIKHGVLGNYYVAVAFDIISQSFLIY